MKKFKFYAGLLKGQTLRYLIVVLLGIFISLIPLCSNYLIKFIVDDVIIGEQFSLIMPILITYMSLTVIRMLIWYYNQYTLVVIGQDVGLKMRQRCFKKIMSLDFSYFDKHRTGDIMTIITADMDFIRQFYAFTVYTIIEYSVTFLGAVAIIMFMSDLYFISIVAVIVPLVGYLTYRLTKEMKPCFRRIRETRAHLNTIAQENISANKVVKTFQCEDYECSKMEDANEEFKNQQINSINISRKYTPFLTNISNIFTIYIIIVCGLFVIYDKMSMGQLIMINSMVWMLTTPLSQVGYVANYFTNCMASTEKMLMLLETKPDITNYSLITKRRMEGCIEFKDVSFGYESEHAIKDMSFSINKGERVAFIGKAGSGKSTIINLISRFYEADDGLVLIDGINIKNLDLEFLRRNISVSQQDVFLFSDTIAKNIAYGNVTASQEEIEEAAKSAKAHDFIMELPDKYETIIGERGVGLSGGQKQRLTLARALLNKSAVLILDDTTSALDANTEKYIQESLKTDFADKTVIIISQRISSVKDCDKIIVLDDGKIREQGTHEQLLENKDYYYGIYERQYGSGVEGEVDING
ncbi:MAG: ABC transporter ATP-binding protein [Clostridia bacterium]|nr:ABC transporter ATP-binding protein [Clostridia bacterium]